MPTGDEIGPWRMWGDCTPPFQLLRQRRLRRKGTKRTKWLCDSLDLTKDKQLDCLREEQRLTEEELKYINNRIIDLQSN